MCQAWGITTEELEAEQVMQALNGRLTIAQ
jgi:hypothetical protein